jgi:predicted NBD/HSP70 family sugar kinase
MQSQNVQSLSLRQPSESESQVLSLILRAGGATQPDIVRASGLSQQTVSRLVNDLVGRGALNLGQRRSNGRRGQPSIEIAIAHDYAYALGVALMTDAISILLMDFAGNVVDYKFIEMPEMGREAVFTRIEQARTEFLERTPAAASRLVGVGVGILGPCLDGKARFNPPRALDEWAMIPIDALFADRLGLPCWAESDGNAAAVGESFLGAGRSYANFVYLYIAAGLGGGIIVNHRLLRGSHGNSGEIGRMLPWRNFQIPTLETLLQTLRKSGVELDSLSTMLATFDADWPGVNEWIAQSRDQFSLITSAIAALVDPEAIVFGGRLPPALANRLIPAIDLFDDARREMPRPLPRLIASQTRFDACAAGAAMLPLEQIYFSSML